MMEASYFGRYILGNSNSSMPWASRNCITNLARDLFSGEMRGDEEVDANLDKLRAYLSRYSALSGR